MISDNLDGKVILLNLRRLNRVANIWQNTDLHLININYIHLRNKLTTELTIVIPTYNEYENITLLVSALDKALLGMAWEVLFVDDEPKARKLVGGILSDEYLCRVAESAEQALNFIAVEVPDIIVSDIKLPGKNGISLLSEIHCIHPELPVILITGHSEKSLAIQAIKAGAFDYLEKPFVKS